MTAYGALFCHDSRTNEKTNTKRRVVPEGRILGLQVRHGELKELLEDRLEAFPPDALGDRTDAAHGARTKLLLVFVYKVTRQYASDKMTEYLAFQPE